MKKKGKCQDYRDAVELLSVECCQVAHSDTAVFQQGEFKDLSYCEIFSPETHFLWAVPLFLLTTSWVTILVSGEGHKYDVMLVAAESAEKVNDTLQKQLRQLGYKLYTPDPGARE